MSLIFPNTPMQLLLLHGFTEFKTADVSHDKYILSNLAILDIKSLHKLLLVCTVWKNSQMAAVSVHVRRDQIQTS